MSGALIELVSKGVQDAYIISEDGVSLFKLKYNRHTNFAMAPKKIQVFDSVANSITSVKIPALGDLINEMWLEADNIATYLSGTTFELFIGGQLIDSHTYDYLADIWPVYMAENSTKSQTMNNAITQSNRNFFPLHFFFCDNGLFLPLIALQYHEVEIKIHWGSTPVSNIRVCANYVYLDTAEREAMSSRKMDIMVTQVQKIDTTLSQGKNDIDLSYFNHPVKSLYFGFEAESPLIQRDRFTFSSADIQLNGTYVLEDMTPDYFHTVQGYYRCPNGVINYDSVFKCPVYTRYYTYNFCMNANEYRPTGTCNFSRIENGKLTLRGVEKGTDRTTADIKIYAVNYNILRIERGLGGILFGN
ncbi:hypothetical protein N9095_00195 [bacterium]|nr:hypothetical protein [bacterium]